MIKVSNLVLKHGPSQSSHYFRVVLTLACTICLRHLRLIISLTAKNEEVEKLGYKLSGYMWGQFA